MPTDASLKNIASEQLDVQKQIEVNTGAATAAAASPSMPATTTAQEDITTAGQRRINLIWEYSQAIIALLVVLFAMLLNGTITIMLIAKGKDLTAAQTIGLSFVNLICGMVISFYFSRTNHAAIGGVGIKPTDYQKYVGR